MDAGPISSSDGLKAAWLAYRSDLLRRARGMDPSGDAEDILQEVWLRLEAIREPIANPRAYLMRMVYSAVLDRRRSVARSAARDAGWVAGDAAELRNAERAMIAAETLARVDARLRSLGEPTNTIFRLYRFSDRKQRDIAEQLGLGLRTVEKHLQKAYVALQDLRDPHET